MQEQIVEHIMLGGLFKNKKQEEQMGNSNCSEGCFSEEDGAVMLNLARQSIELAVQNDELLVVSPNDFDVKFHEKKGVFVTLNREGSLRGCVGSIVPDYPLYKTIIDRSYDAALNDNRFYPVKPDELPIIDIEISVLTSPTVLEYDDADDLLAKIRPNIDGLVMVLDSSNFATFLPQVWDQIPSPEQFLAELAKKAGGNADSWRKDGIKVETYQAEKFKEKEL